MTQDKFSLLRTILKALGLSQDAIDDIIDRISDFLSEKDGKSQGQNELGYPYFVRDDFLSPAEHSFFQVLKLAVSDTLVICTKVSLSDLFYAKSNDPSLYRSLTNKIDRKHVDFLLCDPLTVRPLVGIELDDKSHQRSDRQARDAFVETVFRSAKLPLIRIPVRQFYPVNEIIALLKPYFVTQEDHADKPSTASDSELPPRCPKCGSEMVLRKAKMGTTLGEQFWGCSNFPRCRGIVKYEAAN